MSSSLLINWLILGFILLGSFCVVYRFDRRIDRLYFRLNHLASNKKALLSGFSKLESCSISWLISLVIYKYLICPLRHIDQAWFNREIWYGVLLFILIEFVEGLFLYIINRKNRK